MKWLLLSMLVVVGCTSQLPEPSFYPNHADRRTLDVAVEQWNATEDLPPAADRCARRLAGVRIAVTGDHNHAEWCASCPPGRCPGYRGSEACPSCSSACHVRDCFGTWPTAWVPWCDKRDLFVRHESTLEGSVDWSAEPPVFDLPKDATIVPLHELMHMLEACSGYGVDRAHGDPDGPDGPEGRAGPVWGPDGVLRRTKRELSR